MRRCDVLLGTYRVGALWCFEDDHFEFAFDETWIGDPERPILGQLFEDRRPNPILSDGTLPCWFLHLLPQGPLARMLAAQAAVSEDESFDLLAYLGEDLPGNVYVRPSAQDGAGRKRPERSELRADSPEIELGFSLAGAQWKLSARSSANERGLVVPARGQSGDWIAKFSSTGYPNLPAVEFACAEWARRSGIEIPATRLAKVAEFERLPSEVPIGDGTVYLIRRFDREDGGLRRVHIEDFAQIVDRPPGYGQFQGAYEEIAALIASITPKDTRRFVDQLMFCILSGNGDAHLKNWSLIYPDGRNARLSPAYDLVPTVLYGDQDLALSLGGTKEFSGLGGARLEGLARALGVLRAELDEWVREAESRTRTAWEFVQESGLFSHPHCELLSSHLARVRF